nr:uncharacterized protein LOC127493483 isoform X1 [Oryctolagus cuniculus]
MAEVREQVQGFPGEDGCPQPASLHVEDSVAASLGSRKLLQFQDAVHPTCSEWDPQCGKHSHQVRKGRGGETGLDHGVPLSSLLHPSPTWLTPISPIRSPSHKPPRPNTGGSVATRGSVTQGGRGGGIQGSQMPSPWTETPSYPASCPYAHAQPLTPQPGGPASTRRHTQGLAHMHRGEEQGDPTAGNRRQDGRGMSLSARPGAPTNLLPAALAPNWTPLIGTALAASAPPLPRTQPAGCGFSVRLGRAPIPHSCSGRTHRGNRWFLDMARGRLGPQSLCSSKGLRRRNWDLKSLREGRPGREGMSGDKGEEHGALILTGR